jgi:hypothetical protein
MGPIIYDNTGGESPEVPAQSWHLAATPWPCGPYVGGSRYPKGDPLEVLARARTQPGRDDYVLVKLDEIKAVLERRVCRATQIFDRDEDGPMKPKPAYCMYQAGHIGHHGNGYFSWPAKAVE